jgi:hypothetical protein
MIGDVGQGLDEGGANGSIPLHDHQAIDLATTEAVFELMTDPRQQRSHDIVPTSIEEKTAAYNLPGLCFFVFGSSPDPILLAENVACTGKQFALPCESEPSDQFHVRASCRKIGFQSSLVINHAERTA